MSDAAPTPGGIKSALTYKIGPLPAWAWGVGLGLAINGGRYLYHRHAAAPAASDGEAAADGGGAEEAAADGSAGSPSPSGGLPGAWPGGGLPGSTTGTPGQDTEEPTPTPTTPGFLDNDQWRQAAETAMYARGYPTLEVANAFSALFGEGTITRRQEALIAEAARLVGPPPFGLPPYTVVPDPVTPGPTGPTGPGPTGPTGPGPTGPTGGGGGGSGTGAGTYTVKAGDTFYGMIAHAWGRNPTVSQLKSVASTNGIKLGPAPNYSPSPWKVGQKVKIPAAPK